MSSADRDFLRSDPDEYSRQARHARENAIRERVGNALLDIPILVDELPDELLHDALTLEDADEDPASALPELVSFLYQHYGSEHKLAGVVEDGVERVWRKQNDPVKARVSIRLFDDEIAEIEQRLDEDGVKALDHRELEDLWKAGRLDDEEYVDLVDEWEGFWQEQPSRTVRGVSNVAREKVKRRESFREKVYETRLELGWPEEEAREAAGLEDDVDEE